MRAFGRVRKALGEIRRRSLRKMPLQSLIDERAAVHAGLIGNSVQLLFCGDGQHDSDGDFCDASWPAASAPLGHGTLFRFHRETTLRLYLKKFQSLLRKFLYCQEVSAMCREYNDENDEEDHASKVRGRAAQLAHVARRCPGCADRRLRRRNLRGGRAQLRIGVVNTGTSSTRVFGKRRRTRVGFAPWKRKPSPSCRSSQGRPSRSVAASRAIARIDPYFLLKVAERLLNPAHEAVIVRAVGDEESAHTCPTASYSTGKIWNRGRKRTLLSKTASLRPLLQFTHSPNT